MVELIDSERVQVCYKYYELGFNNAINKCFIQPETKEKLLEAANDLPEGYKFLIWDVYRPFALQEELFYAYREDIIKEFHLEDKNELNKNLIINCYVALPSHEHVPVHTTGCAVDLTIIDNNGNLLNMGSDFDEFSNKVNTDYYIDSDEVEIKNHRALLYNVMVKHGFVNLPSEWWHYSYGDKFWGDSIGNKPLHTKEEECPI